MNRLWVTNKVDKLFGEVWILVSAAGGVKFIVP